MVLLMDTQTAAPKEQMKEGLMELLMASPTAVLKADLTADSLACL